MARLVSTEIPREATMFDGHLRTGVDRLVKPVGRSFQRVGVSADHLTAAGIVTSVGAAASIGAGYLQLGLLLLVLAALPDLLDGAVAKAAGTSSRRGAFFDSTADRVTDSLLLGGIAWYLAGADGGRAALLPMAVLATAQVISYMRAKAESLGFDAKGGLMERAERIIVLALGLLFESLLVGVLWVLLVLSLITAGQRFVKVWRQATVEVPLPARPAARRRRVARMERLEQRARRRDARLRARRRRR